MSKFLDVSGLNYLWQKLKSKFYTKAEVDQMIANKSITYSYSNGTLTIEGINKLQ